MTNRTPFKFTCDIRRVAYGADTLAELSAIYCRVRDRSGEGASTFPSPLVYKNGRSIVPLGYIAYNGRIFEGRPQEWTAATKLLYDNRIEG